MHPEEEEKWLDETLGSLDGIRRAPAPTDLLEKALQRRQRRPARIIPIASRQSWMLAASFALLLSANIWVCLHVGKARTSASAAANFGQTYFSFAQTPDF